MNAPNSKQHKSGRYTEWINGVPVPRYAPVFSKTTYETLRASALSNEYELKINPLTDRPYPDEEKFKGMTCAEVIAAREAQASAEGSIENLRLLEDRVLGKAKQTIDQNTQITVNLQDFARQVREREAQGNYDAKIYVPPDHYITKSDHLFESEVIDVTPQPKKAFNPLEGL